MSEQSRKHGWFDPRYPTPAKHPLAIPFEGRRPVSDRAGLGWADFVAACYPGTHRHELPALTAYAIYREGRVEPVVPPRLLSAVLDWEWEGGALARNGTS